MLFSLRKHLSKQTTKLIRSFSLIPLNFLMSIMFLVDASENMNILPVIIYNED